MPTIWNSWWNDISTAGSLDLRGRQCLLSTSCLLVLLAQVGHQPLLGETRVAVTPARHSDVAGLIICHPARPDDRLLFGTCDAVLDGNRDFGLFQLRLAIPPTDREPAWQIDENRFRYASEYAPGILLQFEGVARTDGLDCCYSVTNQTETALQRVHIHTCVRTTQAPSFFPQTTPDPLSPNPRSTNDDTQPGDFTAIYERLWLWFRESRFSFADHETDRREPHLAFMRAGEPPINWAWWVNSTRQFDFPLIVLESRDQDFVTGLWFEQAVWASCNAGDSRVCFHLFPWLGRIEPGATASVEGKFVLARGSPTAIYRQLRASEDDESQR